MATKPKRPTRIIPTRLLALADLSGILFFAVAGAMAAAAAHLDVFGLLTLAFVTALGGGIVRDLLSDAIPPASIRDWRQAAIAVIGGAVVFFLHHQVREPPASVLGTITAVGGGTIRDMLLAQVPLVLRAAIYAVAAMAAQRYL